MNEEVENIYLIDCRKKREGRGYRGEMKKGERGTGGEGEERGRQKMLNPSDAAVLRAS